MRSISLSQGYVAVVDDADVQTVLGGKWSAVVSRSGVVYAVREAGKKRQIMHRLLLGAKPGQEVDHINGNGLDNRRENLRIATHRQNSLNVPKKERGRSKYKGVSWRADRERWRATINVNRRQIYLGLHETEESAAVAYNNAAKELYGEFAYLNPI